MAYIGRYVGTGRARCYICGNIIKVGERGISANQWQDSRKFCKKCVLATLLGVNSVSDNMLALMEMAK